MPKKETETKKTETKKKKTAPARRTKKASAVPGKMKKDASSDKMKKKIPAKKIAKPRAPEAAEAFEDIEEVGIPEEIEAVEAVDAVEREDAAEDGFFIRWRERDFYRSATDKFIYFLSLAASPVVIYWAYLDNNLITMLTFALLMTVVIFELKTKARFIDYGISIDGIQIGDKLYKFDEFKSFGMSERGGYDMVRLRMKSTIMPMKDIYLHPGMDVRYVHALVEYFLPEEEQPDMLLDGKSGGKTAEEEYIDKQIDEFLKDRI